MENRNVFQSSSFFFCRKYFSSMRLKIRKDDFQRFAEINRIIIIQWRGFFLNRCRTVQFFFNDRFFSKNVHYFGFTSLHYQDKTNISIADHLIAEDAVETPAVLRFLKDGLVTVWSRSQPFRTIPPQQTKAIIPLKLLIIGHV